MKLQQQQQEGGVADKAVQAEIRVLYLEAACRIASRLQHCFSKLLLDLHRIRVGKGLLVRAVRKVVWGAAGQVVGVVVVQGLKQEGV
jgi:hypothetical protein